jgi:hypothetical protein
MIMAILLGIGAALAIMAGFGILVGIVSLFFPKD